MYIHGIVNIVREDKGDRYQGPPPSHSQRSCSLRDLVSRLLNKLNSSRIQLKCMGIGRMGTPSIYCDVVHGSMQWLNVCSVVTIKSLTLMNIQSCNQIIQQQ